VVVQEHRERLLVGDLPVAQVLVDLAGRGNPRRFRGERDRLGDGTRPEIVHLLRPDAVSDHAPVVDLAVQIELVTDERDRDACAGEPAAGSLLPVQAVIAIRLRESWNARGAADLVKVETELSTLMGWTAAAPYREDSRSRIPEPRPMNVARTKKKNAAK
jgi:hypothetical protein